MQSAILDWFTVDRAIIYAAIGLAFFFAVVALTEKKGNKVGVLSYLMGLFVFVALWPVILAGAVIYALLGGE